MCDYQAIEENYRGTTGAVEQSHPSLAEKTANRIPKA